MTTFKLKVSKRAENLDYDEIPAEIRTPLFAGIKYDKNKHDIYRFFVDPDFNIIDKRSKRIKKRKDYELVDSVYVTVKAPVPELMFVGIFPETSFANGKKASTHLPIIDSLRSAGKARDIQKRGEHSILSGRTDFYASWRFLKPHIASGQGFSMQVVCVVPKALSTEQRYLMCDAAALNKNRIIDEARARRILLPKEEASV